MICHQCLNEAEFCLCPRGDLIAGSVKAEIVTGAGVRIAAVYGAMVASLVAAAGGYSKVEGTNAFTRIVKESMTVAVRAEQDYSRTRK